MVSENTGMLFGIVDKSEESMYSNAFSIMDPKNGDVIWQNIIRDVLYHQNGSQYGAGYCKNHSAQTRQASWTRADFTGLSLKSFGLNKASTETRAEFMKEGNFQSELQVFGPNCDQF